MEMFFSIQPKMFSSEIPEGSPNFWVISTWAKIFLKQMFLNHHNPVMIRNESKQPKRTFFVHFLKQVDVTTLHPNCDMEALGCFGDLPPHITNIVRDSSHSSKVFVPSPTGMKLSTQSVRTRSHDWETASSTGYKLLNNWLKLELSFMTI